MKATMLYGPGDIRFEDRPDPKIVKPTDAIIKISATCVCGSDLWPYRGVDGIKQPRPMGHEYCGVVAQRQKIALEYGATDIVTERGGEGIDRIKEMTKGIGADSVLECVGTKESMMQATNITRPGGFVGFVGVPHEVQFDGQQLFFSHAHLHGGPAPVRRYLPDHIQLVLKGEINPGKVFDLTLPLNQVAEGYKAMDDRRAIKALLIP
jgi:threonine dehydrogenase-like Zn-dependent dehydrogenase